MFKLFQILLKKAKSWSLNKQQEILRLQRSITLRGLARLWNAELSFCLVLISFGIWQICMIQMHSAEACGMLSQWTSCLGSPHLGSSSEENISFCSCQVLPGEYQSFPPNLSFEFWQKSLSFYCLKNKIFRLMILTFLGDKRKTSKYQGMWILTAFHFTKYHSIDLK
jgi:hypothetical protein